jgi:cytochrome c553
MVTALAANFNALNPPPLGGAPRQLVATGGKIFQDGLPDQDIAACAACHGPEAAGAGLIPRLAGQLYPYVIDKLLNWGKERGQNPKIPDTSAIMSPVAAQPQQVADRSGCGLCQHSEITSVCLTAYKKRYDIEVN